MAGNASLNAIVLQQATAGWNVLLLSVAAFLFLVSAFAETNRLPFDLPEAESELITGYHTEYSAMKFSLFFIAEYANMITASALFVTLFLGGWDIPFTLWDNTGPATVAKSLATMAMFAAKVLFFVFFYIWIRWTLPRFRYDQLMSLGWKVMLPTALAYIVIVSTAILGLDYAGLARGSWGFLLSMLGRGRLISPADRRIDEVRLARLRQRAPRRATLAPGEIR
jgi:NADH-quinone oxidoreductase subunit H